MSLPTLTIVAALLTWIGVRPGTFGNGLGVGAAGDAGAGDVGAGDAGAGAAEDGAGAGDADDDGVPVAGGVAPVDGAVRCRSRVTRAARSVTDTARPASFEVVVRAAVEAEGAPDVAWIEVPTATGARAPTTNSAAASRLSTRTRGTRESWPYFARTKRFPSYHKMDRHSAKKWYRSRK
jgi:hypothetical protein